MFSHLFINRLKVLLKNKTVIFWTLIFPLVIATLFNLAFSNLLSSEQFKAFDIAVIENSNLKNETNFKEMLELISAEDDNKIFNIKYVSTEKEAEQLLIDNKIKGYFIVNEKIDIFIKNNGVEQTIMKYVVDNYYQTNSVINNIAQFNPELLKTGLIQELNNDKNYFNDINNSNIDFSVVYFYSLLGMICLYGAFFSIDAINETEANLSKRAARLSVSPANKLKALLVSLLVSLIVQFAEILILLAYLIFVLGVNFSGQIGLVILISFIGSLAGISMGMLIGAATKKSIPVKTAISLAVIMTCSFLSGMMMWQMKYIIQNNIPIINKINPVCMITDGLYALYYYDTLDRYYYNVISLIIFSIIMIILSYFFIRRKKYDSI